MENRKPVITDYQRELIVKQANIIGEDGVAMIEDIENAALESGQMAADIFKLIESCMASLNQKVRIQMQSEEIIRQKEPERLRQIEAIREQATMLLGSRLNGDKPGEESVMKTMRKLVNKYMAAVDQDKADGLDPDTVRLWKEQVQGIVAHANLDQPAANEGRSGPDPALLPEAIDLPGPSQMRQRSGALHCVCRGEGANGPRGDHPAWIREAVGELEEGDHGLEQRPRDRSAGGCGDGGDPAGERGVRCHQDESGVYPGCAEGIGCGIRHI
jgi:hypothetical protein